MNNLSKIIIEAIPIILMIALIPLIKNDLILSLVYIIIIIIAFKIKYEKTDTKFFIFGLIALTISELIFISTGVETFNRNNFLGLMPTWLPLLWAYAFVVIKRSIEILK